MRSPSRSDLILFALVILNLCIKLLWLGRNELGHDEPFTVVQAHKSWADLYAMLRDENNPPLYFVLMKVWCTYTPMETAWLRVPSALFSASIVWPLFQLSRALGGVRAAVIAALLFTFNNYMFGYAHEVRAYALFALLSVATTWQLWRMAQGEKRGSIWYALVAIALVYTHFFGWLMIGLHGLMVLVLPQFRPALINLAKALLVVCLFYLPYAAIFISRFSTSVEHGTWLSAPVPEELYNMLWRWSNEPLIVIALLLVIITAVIRTKLKDVAVNVGLLWTFVPLLGMFLISYRIPIFLDRYLIFVAPGFFLLSAVALLRIIPQGKWALIPAASIVLAMAVTFSPWKNNRSHPSYVIDQVAKWNTGSPVLIQPAYYEDTYAWHYDPQLVRTPAILRSELNASRIFPVNDDTDLPFDLSTTTAVVLVNASGSLSDHNGSLIQRLRNAYPIIDSIEADRKVWVYRYSRVAGLQ